MAKTTWEKVMACKKAGKPRTNKQDPVANDLTDDELNTIFATIDFFGGNVRQAYFDLAVARYRVFDALGMYCMGRLEETPTKVLVYAFLDAKGDVDKFIDNLRYHDYEVETKWENIQL